MANFHACIYRKVAVVEDCVPGITVCTRCSACFQTSAVHTAVQHCNAVVVQSGFSVRNVVHGAYALYRESAVVGDCVLSVNVGDCLFVEVDCYFLSFGNNNAFGNVAKQRDCFPCGYCVNSRLQGNIAYSVVQSNVLAFNNRCVAFFIHFGDVSHIAVGIVTVMYRCLETTAAYVERRCLVGNQIAHHIACCATVDGAYTAVVLTAVNYRSDFVVGHVVVRPTDYLTCEVSAVKFGITPVLHRLVGCRECSAVYRQSAEFVVLYGNGSSRNKFATVNGKYGVLSVGSFVGIVPAVVYQR